MRQEDNRQKNPKPNQTNKQTPQNGGEDPGERVVGVKDIKDNHNSRRGRS